MKSIAGAPGRLTRGLLLLMTMTAVVAAACSTSPTASESTAAGTSAGSTAATTSSRTRVASFDEICELVPVDAGTLAATGREWTAGRLTLQQLQQLVSAMQVRWTTFAKSDYSLDEAKLGAIADRMVRLLSVTAFAIEHGEEPYIIGSDWTGGDLATDYRRGCGRPLTVVVPTDPVAPGGSMASTGSSTVPDGSPQPTGSVGGEQECVAPAALISGLTTHRDDGITRIDRTFCESGYVTALGHTASYAEILLFRQADAAWVEVDRAAACAADDLPPGFKQRVCSAG